MEARILRNLALIAAFFSCGVSSSFAADHRTQNFIVTAATKELAVEVGNAAEAYRRDLAIEWLGQELPPWGGNICPITVHTGPQMLAGGVTSFAFDRGRPFEWTMEIRGTRQRVLDSVLPHEITHTIFATHFGRPLPRWADEGACTTVEHVSEREKQYALLIQFLTTNRGIAFNRMFAMREYPKDILPLYAQGYTLARYLIAQGGKKKFVQYVGDGMRTNDWPAATKKYYQFQDLSELQVTWLNWIKKGSPLDLEQHPTLLARNSTMRRSPNETFVATTNPSQNAISDYDGMAPFGRQTRPVTPNVATRPNTFNATADYQAPINQMAHTTQNQPNVAKGNNSSGQSGWYARQRDITKHGITQHGIAQQNNTQLNDTQQLGSRGQIATVTSSAGQPPMSLAPSFNNSNAQSNSQTVASSPKAINAPQRFNHANASINQAHPMQPLQEYARAQLAQSRARQNQSTQHAQSTQHTQATRQYANGVILAQPRRVDDAAVVNSAQWGKTTQAPTARTAVRPMAPQRPQQMIMEPQRGGTYTGGGYVPNGLIRR